MTAQHFYADIFQQMTEVSTRIGKLLNELRPISDKIMIGKADNVDLKKNVRLQDKINRLHELREKILTSN